MKFSIIMPVYNAERFLSQCIESVMRQAFDDWELIVGNDGSTDGSIKIIKKYALKDRRIHHFSQANKGVSMTRNYAMDLAKGDYLLFIDADDVLCEDALTIIDEVLKEDEYDVVKFNMKRIDIFGNIIRSKSENVQEKRIIINGESDKKKYVYPLLCGAQPFGFAWNFAVRHEVVSKIRFSADMIMCEDLLFDMAMYEAANKIIFIPNVLYFYRDNPLGAVQKFDYRKIDNIKTAYMEKLYLAKKYFLSDSIEEEARSFFCGTILQFYMNILDNAKLCREYRIKIMQDRFVLGEFEKFLNAPSGTSFQTDILFGTSFVRWKKRIYYLLRKRIKRFILKMRYKHLVS